MAEVVRTLHIDIRLTEEVADPKASIVGKTQRQIIEYLQQTTATFSAPTRTATLRVQSSDK